MSKFRPDRRHPVNERDDRPLPERRRRKKATAEARTRIGSSLRAPTVRLSAAEGPDGQRTDDTGRCEAGRLPHEAAFEVEKIRNGNDTPKKNEGTTRPKQKRSTGSGARKKHGPAYRPSPHFPSYSRIRRNRYTPLGESAVKLCSTPPRSEKFQISESCTPASRNAS